MMLTLTLTDLQGDPVVGMTVAITGSAGGTVQLYYTPVGRPYPGDDWLPGSFRVGDGDIQLETTLPGLYFVYAVEGATVSPPVIGQATEAETAVATRCRRSIVDVLKLLNLEQIDDRVLEQIYPDDSEMKFPCISVHIAGLSETQDPGLNQLDDIIYPIRVMLYDKQSPTDHRPLPRVERWRQSISRAFRNQHLPGVLNSVKVTVEPLVIADQELPKYQHYAGGFVIRCTMREPRGIGA